MTDANVFMAVHVSGHSKKLVGNHHRRDNQADISAFLPVILKAAELDPRESWEFSYSKSAAIEYSLSDSQHTRQIVLYMATAGQQIGHGVGQVRPVSYMRSEKMAIVNACNVYFVLE